MTQTKVPGLEAANLTFADFRGKLVMSACISAQWTQHQWIREEFERQLNEWDKAALPTEDDVMMPLVVNPWPNEFAADSMRRVSAWGAVATIAFALAFGVQYAHVTAAGHYAHIMGHPGLANLDRLWFAATAVGFIICFLVTGMCSILWQVTKKGGIPL